MDSLTTEDPVALVRSAMFEPEGLQDPYPLLRRLHEYGERLRMPDGTHVVFGYGEVMELMRSPAFAKPTHAVPTPAFVQASLEEEAELRQAIGEEPPFLVFLNQPDHGRIRGLAGKAFLPRHLTAVRPVIQATIERLLDQLDPTQPVDVIADFSSQFAPEVVGELIGLPSEHRAKVADLTAIFMRGVDPGASFAARRDASHARRTQADYVREVIADRRRSPRDDFITALIGANDEDRATSSLELVALIQILYVGGYETTSHMIGNGVVALLRNPEQLALLVSEPVRMRAAVDEMLRFDGPISLTEVVATAGATLGGEPAEEGATYVGLLAAANHDPAIFALPERFDIARQRQAHLAFGGGPHFCLGSGLAKLELELVFTELLRRYPAMRFVDSKPRRIPAFHQRAFESVQLQLVP